jgi:hypothetical protein
MEFGHRRGLLPDAQWEQARLMLLNEGREQAARLPGHLDPIYWLGEFDSENYNWMSRFSGLLWTEQFPDPVYGSFHAQHLGNVARALAHAGRLEWDSMVYAGFVISPALRVFEYSQDSGRRAQARAVVDWLLATMAIKHLDGGMVGPDARAKDIAAMPLQGSAWFMMYMYILDAGYAPAIPADAFASAVTVDVLGQLPWSSYRPPQAVVNLAQRNFATPVLMRNCHPFYRIDDGEYSSWQGLDGSDGRRFEFETMYLERNYTFGSVAAGRPNGAYQFPDFGLYGNYSMPFSEQSVWRLGVLSDGVSAGPQQVFGNTGREFPDLNGRSPYEQVGQGSNTLLRAFTGTDQAWVAFPNTSQAVLLPGSEAVLALDFGHGVYAGVLPWSPTARVVLRCGAFARTSQRATQCVWSGFANSSFNALAMEVGTAAAHGSFVDFQQRLAVARQLRAGAVLGSIEFWDSLRATNLTVVHTGLGNYTMRDGTVLAPAGRYPEVYVNGTFLDFSQFNSYEVVLGEPILTQAWGSGQLTVQAGGAGYRLQVDSATAAAAFFTL